MIFGVGSGAAADIFALFLLKSIAILSPKNLPEMKALYLLPLLLFSCNTATPPAETGGNSVPAATPAIQLIEVVTQGGQLGYHTTCKITKDSVTHKLLVGTDTTKNTSFARATNEGEWQALLQNIDLKEFDAAQNGESRQPVDGTDTEISITSNGERISKTNAHNSAAWTRIQVWSAERCME